MIVEANPRICVDCGQPIYTPRAARCSECRIRWDKVLHARRNLELKLRRARDYVPPPPKPPAKTIAEAIKRQGTDEDFTPHIDDDFVPTDAPVGSAERVAVLAERVKRGHPIFHPQDNQMHSGTLRHYTTGAGSRGGKFNEE